MTAFRYIVFLFKVNVYDTTVSYLIPHYFGLFSDFYNFRNQCISKMDVLCIMECPFRPPAVWTKYSASVMAILHSTCITEMQRESYAYLSLFGVSVGLCPLLRAGCLCVMGLGCCLEVHVGLQTSDLSPHTLK